MSNFSPVHCSWSAQRRLENWARAARERTFPRSSTSTASSTDSMGEDIRSSKDSSSSISTNGASLGVLPSIPSPESESMDIPYEEVASISSELAQASEAKKSPVTKTLSAGSSGEASTFGASTSAKNGSNRIPFPITIASTSSAPSSGWSFTIRVSRPASASSSPSSGAHEWLRNKAARLVRTPSISSQSSVESSTSKNEHRGSSPSIKTFAPDGRCVLEGNTFSDFWSPLLGRSPSPHRASSLGTSPQLSSKGSTISVASCDASPSPRLQRCPSPLLLPPLKMDRSNSLVESSTTLPLPPASPLGAFKRELYTRKEGPVCIALSQDQKALGPSLGRLHFRLKYDFDKSDLTVYLIEAHNLSGADKGGFTDPFVKVNLIPEVDQRDRQTAVHKSSSDHPVFNQEFKFPVSYDDVCDKTLLLRVNDCDRYVRNEIIGEVKISLSEFNLSLGVEVWAEICRQLRPGEELQEVLVSLSYLPSAERLTVVIITARNLLIPCPPHGKSSTVYPSAKVYLLVAGKRVKKRKINSCKGTADPVWNEPIIFSLTAENLENAALEICVTRGNQEVGWCCVGITEDGREGQHWNQMMNQPRKSISMWHTLR